MNVNTILEIIMERDGLDMKEAIYTILDTRKEILEAIEYGVTDVGENKPQELARKYDIIGDKVKWHLIGSLQTNKVKYIIDKVSMIHSLDRESLCEMLSGI